jgi:hypothetical protein
MADSDVLNLLMLVAAVANEEGAEVGALGIEQADGQLVLDFLSTLEDGVDFWNEASNLGLSLAAVSTYAPYAQSVASSGLTSLARAGLSAQLCGLDNLTLQPWQQPSSRRCSEVLGAR